MSIEIIVEGTDYQFQKNETDGITIVTDKKKPYDIKFLPVSRRTVNIHFCTSEAQNPDFVNPHLIRKNFINWPDTLTLVPEDGIDPNNSLQEGDILAIDRSSNEDMIPITMGEELIANNDNHIIIPIRHKDRSCFEIDLYTYLYRRMEGLLDIINGGATYDTTYENIFWPEFNVIMSGAILDSSHKILRIQRSYKAVFTTLMKHPMISMDNVTFFKPVKVDDNK